MNKALYSTGNTDWETPQDLFDIINKIFKFDIDVCATAANTKCRKYYTEEQDGLKQKWEGNVWCNPPYGRDIGEWVSKACHSHCNKTTVVMLLPARTDTKWFHERVFMDADVIFLKGRLKFGGGKGSAPFPSMIAIWGYKKHKEVLKLEYELTGERTVKRFMPIMPSRSSWTRL